ncbi:MAG: hypothetical protein AB2L11_12720 [Syntrophobacteraceae bacterium]
MIITFIYPLTFLNLQPAPTVATDKYGSGLEGGLKNEGAMQVIAIHRLCCHRSSEKNYGRAQ